MKIVTITGGEIIIDDDDFERVLALNWYIPKDKPYPVTNVFNPKFPGTGKKTKLRLHRFIMKVTDSTVLLDHRNGNPLDNRKENLRYATQEQNKRNRKMCTRNKSGYKGVYRNSHDTGWVAQIRFDKKVTVIGTTFQDPYEAHLAYQQKALEFHGEFARFQ